MSSFTRGFTRTTLATPLAVLSLFALVSSSCARADDLTGLPVDDPKDLSPAPQQQQVISQIGSGFVPMPSWARGVVMPPLPDQLKPMGKKSLAASANAPTPAVVQPVKQASIVPTTVGPDGATVASKPETPAMVTVSPFLQWIKANPQAAAAQARQQAAVYHAGPGAGGPGSPPITGPGAPAPTSDDNYWLPPLIDQSIIQNGTTGGSAAIYSKPQRD